MARPVPKQSLSAARRQLVELMQSIGFGRIEYLHVVDGEPALLDPPPAVVREYKFGGENGPRPERGLDAFLLKVQVVELFQMFDRMGTGVVLALDVKHGLPFRAAVPGAVE
ncbi:hypothetical protein [Limnoglobus roseus]|uniref:Uncharacterized protein n=1 Tax=Limnoglobus roseus TaxID=2598579 RepID=A0A5C1AT03_9BACT|nr:hypothetical protein [Limnoglobus roseus]QEL20712.1 hypothetical protein PX52LOC_07821 [Limnoglobus roseus]